MAIKTYRNLTAAEQEQTYKNYVELCSADPSIIPFDNFNDYHNEQCLLDMDFDAATLECLG